MCDDRSSYIACYNEDCINNIDGSIERTCNLKYMKIGSRGQCLMEVNYD